MAHTQYNHRQNEKGSVAVEAAYAFPFLILVFMVMMFLMDVIMVKQEVTVSGFSGMTQCASNDNKSRCLLNIVHEPGSDDRYRCTTNDEVSIAREGTTFVMVNLHCTYEGFTPINAIFRMIDRDMENVLTFDIPVFFPDAC